MIKRRVALGITCIMLGGNLLASPVTILSAENAGVFLEELRKAQRSPGPSQLLPIDDSNLNRALILIGDSNSRGSGFLVSLWGKPVVITNAHVFALMRKPEVTNVNQERFEIQSALIGKIRDLAILEVKSLPEDLPLLKIAPDVSGNKIGSGITAYGDSLGERVIVKADGKLLGIGPDEIEISASIVPGNSGGPVLNDSFEVVGVSTYLRKLTASADILAGTRFAPGTLDLKLIRRFALRIDHIDLNDFELFDEIAQQKDLACYEKFEKLKRLCLNEVTTPHYKWRLYWPWLKPHPIDDYQNISNYLYCYSHFYQTDFKTHFNYRASLSIIQRILDQQLRVFAAISCFIHACPIQLTAEEISSAEQIFQLLQKKRRNKFTCPQCGGTGKVPIPGTGRGVNPPLHEYCGECEGLAKYNVPFWGPWRISPLYTFPRSSYEIFGFRLGMEMNEANKAANETWRRDTREYNIVSVNGLFDCVRVGRNPEFSNRALRTKLKFLARRLLSIAVFFENDQHNLQELKEMLIEKFGKPDFISETPGDWGFLMFVKEDISVTLSYTQGEVVIRAYHRVLQHVEYMMLNTFEQKIFAPPLKTYGGTLDFLP